MSAIHAIRDAAPGTFFASIAAAFTFVAEVISETRKLRNKYGTRNGDDI